MNRAEARLDVIEALGEVDAVSYGISGASGEVCSR